MSARRIRVFVPDAPEFLPLVEAAWRREACGVTRVDRTYWLIEAGEPVEFGRRELGLKPAVWYGLFTGGLNGVIERFDRDSVRIVPAGPAS